MKTGTSITFSRSMTSVSMSHANRKFEYGCITKSPAASIRSFSDKIAFTEPNLFTRRLFTSQPAIEARNDCLVFSRAWSISLVRPFLRIEPRFQLFLLGFCFSSSALLDSESLSKPLLKKSVMCCDSLRMSSSPWFWVWKVNENSAKRQTNVHLQNSKVTTGNTAENPTLAAPPFFNAWQVF